MAIFVKHSCTLWIFSGIVLLLYHLPSFVSTQTTDPECSFHVTPAVFPADVYQQEVTLDLTLTSQWTQYEYYLYLDEERRENFYSNGAVMQTDVVSVVSHNATRVTVTLTRGMVRHDTGVITLVAKLRAVTPHTAVVKRWCHVNVTVLDVPGTLTILVNNTARPCNSDLVLPLVSSHSLDIVCQAANLFPASTPNIRLNNVDLVAVTSHITQNTTTHLYTTTTSTVPPIRGGGDGVGVALMSVYNIITCTAGTSAAATCTVTLQLQPAANTTQDTPDVDHQTHTHVWFVIICVVCGVCVAILIGVVVCVYLKLKNTKRQLQAIKQERAMMRTKSETVLILACDRQLYRFCNTHQCLHPVVKTPDWVDEGTSFFSLKKHIIMLGGCNKQDSNKMFVYDAKNGRKKTQATDYKMGNVTVCSCGKNETYVVGGMAWNEKRVSAVLSDRFTRLSISPAAKFEEPQFVKYEQKRQFPTSVSQLICAYDEQRKVIHCLGGTQTGLEGRGKYYAYDTLTFNWTNRDITIGNSKSTLRSKHSGAVVLGDTLYVFTPTHELTLALNNNNTSTLQDNPYGNSDLDIVNIVPYVQSGKIKALVRHRTAGSEINTMYTYNLHTRTFTEPVRLDQLLLVNQVLVMKSKSLFTPCQEQCTSALKKSASKAKLNHTATEAVQYDHETDTLLTSSGRPSTSSNG